MEREPIETEITELEAKLASQNDSNEEDKGLLRMKLLRLKTILKWLDSGLLEGLHGPIKKNIAELYECCKSHKLK